MSRATDCLNEHRARIRAHHLPDEHQVVQHLAQNTGLDAAARKAVSEHAARLVREVRAQGDVSLMQSFLAEYGLSTEEGVALMCLAEALLRVPDEETIDALIEDKIAPSDWAKHLGHSSSPLVNASTWGLMLTGTVLAEREDGLAGVLRGALRRLGEPVIRVAVGQAMRELGRNFVLGHDIDDALKNARSQEAKGYTYSYDMLGEAARTDHDARHYHLSYSHAITTIAPASASNDIRENPGISVKLSALLARYEYGQRDRVMAELVARVRSLALLARSANMGFNIDAEEADRLDLSLDVIEALLADPALAGWDGFGVVVQAYGPRAGPVLDWLYALAQSLDRRVMVRLVKGAYWDTEIKRAQVLGLAGFPVFTRKVATDVSFIANARKLLGMTDRIYPQVATHNAHTIAAVLNLAPDRDCFEFQRLHGMGEAVHELVRAAEGTRCRIYAPVGAHRDLLAYLVRRLLENGANTSFVHQIVDEQIAPETIARDPFEAVEELGNAIANPAIPRPADIFGPGRVAAKGWDLSDPVTVAGLEQQRLAFRESQWQAAPMLAGPVAATAARPVVNPVRPTEVVGHAVWAEPADRETALAASAAGFADWSARPATERAAILRRVSDLYERHAPELFALCAREAGKTLKDCVAEVREAVDFLRYYAAEAERLQGAGRGTVVCISPWNFPLAIFTGQIAAALAAGNAVIAKPAEQTPLVAARAVELMHEAGVPRAALQLLPGDGPGVGAPLTADPRVAGVCFTGSIEAAKAIDRAMAEHLDPRAPLIAETGGLNAMIVDSTALPEQAVRDIVTSSFQSAGQRCSALRMLYVQRDVAEPLLEMLQGAMDELRLGDPWELATDVGPVIESEAREGIAAYVADQARAGRLVKQIEAPAEGLFVPPALIRLAGIEDLEREVFGPVLHVATYEADQLDAVIAAISAKGYGLTFGLHTRIDDRVQHVVDRIHCGNIYVNRDQIGAVVGSQPFGGERLSGTGPKAGGPHYLRRFLAAGLPEADGTEADRPNVTADAVQAALDNLQVEHFAPDPITMPGPTGESNRLATCPRGKVLCLGPSVDAAMIQAREALRAGNAVLLVAPGAPARAAELAGPVAALDGTLPAEALRHLAGFAAAASFAGEETLRAMRQALAARKGPILPLVTEQGQPERYSVERHVCVDTTAAGGNASLLSEAGKA